MQAYRRDAPRRRSGSGAQWEQVRCPVLLIHGLQSDALLAPTIARMSRGKRVTLMHVPDTGHTPLLADRNQIWFIRQWLLGSGQARACMDRAARVAARAPRGDAAEIRPGERAAVSG